MKKYFSIIAAFFIVAVAGCKKDFLSLEVNPNAPSVSTPQFTLAGAEKVSADIVANDYPEYGIWGGYWTSSGNYVPSPALQQYQFTNANYTGVWTDLYSNLTNYNNLQVQAAADPTLANFQAIAIVMKAYDFEQLVDNFNDVPYSQAFQPSTIFFPKYDKGSAIYADLFVQLDNAIVIINGNKSAISPGISDIIFGGNMVNWKKFANTIKLRLAIRQSNIAPASTFTAELAKTSSEGYLDETVQAAANPGYNNTAGKESPFYGNYGYDANGNATGNNAYYRANAFAINLLSKSGDTRLSQLYALTIPPNSPSSAAPSIYRGNVFGDNVVFLSNTNTSAIGAGLLQSPTQNAILLSSAESLFLQSEGVLNGYLTTGTPIDFYQRGITASYVALGLTAAQATTYYTQNINNVSWGSSSNKQQAIITQKWISLNGYNNLEAYNEYRRTGYPVLPQSQDPSAASPTLPTRIYYPASEVATNNTSLTAEGTINPFTSKIFWAK